MNSAGDPKGRRAGLVSSTPLQVKQAVTGYGQALKPQVMEMTRRLLCLQQIPKPDDVADALAMAICHGQAAGSSLRQALLGRRSRDRRSGVCFIVSREH